ELQSDGGRVSELSGRVTVSRRHALGRDALSIATIAVFALRRRSDVLFHRRRQNRSEDCRSVPYVDTSGTRADRSTSGTESEGCRGSVFHGRDRGFESVV